jgi:hypothetical protein
MSSHSRNSSSRASRNTSPQLDTAELTQVMVEAMKKTGFSPAYIFAFEQTGLLVTQENYDLVPEADLAEWKAAMDRYRELNAAPK